AAHVVEIMESVHRSAAEGRQFELTSSCSRPPALVPGTPVGMLVS
ncbi:MAG: hypothetical protein JWO42_74, partial [Chloroflexi bacterium]|nr:hypothetical protein [Chloroflexota bacterium]